MGEGKVKIKYLSGLTIRYNHFSRGVGQRQTAEWQVNIVVKCSNRFPVPKLDF